MLSEPIYLRVAGDYACFTRHEFHVERVSYPVMTPSAARGILEAILMRPIEKPSADGRGDKTGFRWIVLRIGVCKKGTMFSILRNEIKPKEHSRWGYDISDAEGVRTQRHSLILKDVEYVIGAAIEVGKFCSRPRPHDLRGKYLGMFCRRADAGQCYYHPFLGCREFGVSLWERVTEEVAESLVCKELDGPLGDFGVIFNDFDYSKIWTHWGGCGGSEEAGPRPKNWPEFGESDAVHPFQLPPIPARANKGWITVPNHLRPLEF